MMWISLISSKQVIWSKIKLLAAGVVGLGGGYAYSYWGTFGVVDALGPPPFPQQPYCVGRKCPITSWDSNWDRLETGQKCDPKLSHFEKNILIIRHGQYNVTGKLDEDRKLTKLGQEQMKAVAHRLATLNFNYSFVMGSQNTRGKESYSILAEHLDVQSGFNESLNEGFPLAPIPGSATIAGDDLYYKDIMKMEYAFRSLFKRPTLASAKNTFEILVCPANLIRYFICRALQFPPEGWLRWEIPHGSLTWITIYKDGSVNVKSVGEVGFLPPNLVTF
ncbi:hypothetical protein GE061_002031 [Apolygus lucorum]|uniref:Serine/threonine-protein phosphatase PGAM5, mitochondrial n=1 Tax=Apolygus lucorum TaxID=248454 RepID=A0A8S9X5N9_APOLU|nr:hypothetical protein GE061_002031 [Apolygus lucorum]